MPFTRGDLAGRRKTVGFTQEALAERLQVDRSTIVRWERGDTVPQPHIRPKLARLLQVSPEVLAAMLNRPTHEGTHPAVNSVNRLQKMYGLDGNGLDDMNRRELLRLLSVAGSLVATPQGESFSATGKAAPETFSEHELLNHHLWRAFSLSRSKESIFPLVQQQINVLTDSLAQTRSAISHKRLCMLLGDLLQLAGEIFFDQDRYADAAYCYTLAASASKEAGEYDLWACALTRHAFIDIHDGRFRQSASLLSAAIEIANRGDRQLSTRHWVSAVQARAFAGMGDLDSCRHALDAAEQVHTRSSTHNGGWLRFDGSRLAEERGTCYIELNRTELAEGELTDVLTQELSFRRRGSVLSDLAALGAQRHDLDQVLWYGNAAFELAQHTGSGYIGRKLLSLQARVEPLATDSRIIALKEKISTLNSIAR